MIWAVFSELAAFVTRGCDQCSWYATEWMAEQIIGVVLLAIVMWEAVRPPALKVALALLGAFLLVGVAHVGHHFPVALLEPVIEVCGAFILAFGIAATSQNSLQARVLAGYLLLNALLMLAAPDYLDNTGLGDAWSGLEIAAFLVWIWVFNAGNYIVD